MPFDPDAYLAEKDAEAAAKPFDPDAYLAEKDAEATAELESVDPAPAEDVADFALRAPSLEGVGASVEKYKDLYRSTGIPALTEQMTNVMGLAPIIAGGSQAAETAVLGGTQALRSATGLETEPESDTPYLERVLASYREGRNRKQEELDQLMAESPFMGGTGQLLSPAAGLPKGLTKLPVAARVPVAAPIGGLTGAAKSDTDLAGGIQTTLETGSLDPAITAADDLAWDAATGALWETAPDVVAKGLGGGTRSSVRAIVDKLNARKLKSIDDLERAADAAAIKAIKPKAQIAADLDEDPAKKALFAEKVREALGDKDGKVHTMGEIRDHLAARQFQAGEELNRIRAESEVAMTYKQLRDSMQALGIKARRSGGGKPAESPYIAWIKNNKPVSPSGVKLEDVEKSIKATQSRLARAQKLEEALVRAVSPKQQQKLRTQIAQENPAALRQSLAKAKQLERELLNQPIDMNQLSKMRGIAFKRTGKGPNKNEDKAELAKNLIRVEEELMEGVADYKPAKAKFEALLHMYNSAKRQAGTQLTKPLDDPLQGASQTLGFGLRAVSLRLGMYKLKNRFTPEFQALKLHKRSKVLSNPDPKWVKAFEKGVSNMGAQGIPATHYILMQDDPEYAKAYEEDQEAAKE